MSSYFDSLPVSLIMIIEYEQLQQLFGGAHPADVAARMERADVKFKLGKNGRPFTTEAALNHSMGLPVGQITPYNSPEQRPTIKVL
ncbi:MAG: hypothetical protein R3F02_02280 [Thiolinea sp.]